MSTGPSVWDVCESRAASDVPYTSANRLFTREKIVPDGDKLNVAGRTKAGTKCQMRWKSHFRFL